ncbi:hypothetical protein [Nocardia vaccinii]|uniref:hypothetical protein n=1 Tax=Nocardia vaccinii TaxID=1822 RepID=UPI0012F4F1C7|nr:hypothetical protein [Nocardia vaccinii]
MVHQPIEDGITVTLWNGDRVTIMPNRGDQHAIEIGPDGGRYLTVRSRWGRILPLADTEDSKPTTTTGDYLHELLAVLEDIRDDLRAGRNHIETREN